jgi:PadR family transcriptional regulator PadR
MSTQQIEIPYGTLDLLILKTLQTMGPLHGYALARRIEQVSAMLLQLSQGSLYPALIRLEQEGWIGTEWGVSETNRKVKFFSLTKTGRKQLRVEIEKWEGAKALVERFLEAET